MSTGGDTHITKQYSSYFKFEHKLEKSGCNLFYIDNIVTRNFREI